MTSVDTPCDYKFFEWAFDYNIMTDIADEVRRKKLGADIGALGLLHQMLLEETRETNTKQPL